MAVNSLRTPAEHNCRANLTCIFTLLLLTLDPPLLFHFLTHCKGSIEKIMRENNARRGSRQLVPLQMLSQRSSQRSGSIENGGVQSPAAAILTESSLNHLHGLFETPFVVHPHTSTDVSIVQKLFIWQKYYLVWIQDCLVSFPHNLSAGIFYSEHKMYINLMHPWSGFFSSTFFFILCVLSFVRIIQKYRWHLAGWNCCFLLMKPSLPFFVSFAEVIYTDSVSFWCLVTEDGYKL